MFWRMFLAHLTADFVLQTKHRTNNKDKFTDNYIHFSVLLAVSLLLFIDIINLRIVIMLLSVSFLHGILDYLKIQCRRSLEKGWNWILFLADQMLHILLILAIIQIFYPDTGIDMVNELFIRLRTQNWFKVFAFLILITVGGNYFIASLCEKFSGKLKYDEDSLQNAGKYIGILERIIVTASILTGRYELIGFLIAAKSIIRHNAKNDKAFTEYFLIGTLTRIMK